MIRSWCSWVDQQTAYARCYLAPGDVAIIVCFIANSIEQRLSNNMLCELVMAAV